MQMVLFIGIQATGKSSFYRERFFNTHVRISRDMLKTRHREELLLKACLQGKQSFVVDKMNLTRAERQMYILRAKAARFTVIGYCFESQPRDAISRNATRPETERVPIPGIYGAAKRLELPALEEGFDILYSVRLGPEHSFIIEEWPKSQVR